MRIGIAVFEKNWIEAKPLFTFLNAFGVTIKHQDTYGDRMYKIKDTHLIIEDGIGQWVDFEEFEQFLRKDFCSLIHYDSLIHDINKTSVGVQHP